MCGVSASMEAEGDRNPADRRTIAAPSRDAGACPSRIAARWPRPRADAMNRSTCAAIRDRRRGPRGPTARCGRSARATDPRHGRSAPGRRTGRHAIAAAVRATAEASAAQAGASAGGSPTVRREPSPGDRPAPRSRADGGSSPRRSRDSPAVPRRSRPPARRRARRPPPPRGRRGRAEGEGTEPEGRAFGHDPEQLRRKRARERSLRLSREVRAA